MPQSEEMTGTPGWFGGEAEAGEVFGGGKLWIGKHRVDGDILVFDPSDWNPADRVLSFYSLTQHRMRRFASSTVADTIQPLADPDEWEAASQAYSNRESRRDDHQAGLQAEDDARRERQREAVIEAHRSYVESLGMSYEGVRQSDPPRKTRYAPKCHRCGIVLDDFVGVACSLCAGVLCSCGGCNCGKRVAAEE